MLSGEAILEARGIHKHFGHLHVLKGVDLVVAPRELVFIIGPSGSGKSTLLRCCNRLEEPSSGSVVVDGIDLLDRRTDINAARRRIGMVFQSFNLYPHMTALGNVSLALRRVLGKSREEAEAIAHAAEKAGVDADAVKLVPEPKSALEGLFAAPEEPSEDGVVRRGRHKRLSPRRGITYYLLTPDLTGQIEFILAIYEVGASSGEEFFAYPAEQCGLVLEGVADVHLGSVVHRLRAGDSIRFDCAIPHRIVNAGRRELRCIWAITPPTF